MTENEVAKISLMRPLRCTLDLVQVCWSQSTKQLWRMNLEKEGCT